MSTVYKRPRAPQEPPAFMPIHAPKTASANVPKYVWWIIVFVVLAIIGSVMPASKEDKNYYAWYTATEFVKNSLKSPSTAKFSPYNESIAVDMGEGKYQVIGWVDAENSFGAMLRKGWIAKLRLDGERWRCEDIEMD